MSRTLFGTSQAHHVIKARMTAVEWWNGEMLEHLNIGNEPRVQKRCKRRPVANYFEDKICFSLWNELVLPSPHILREK